MNFVKKFFRILWRDHRDGLWFLFFPVFGIYYFFIQHIGLEYRVIHVSLDDKIPFVPAFVIPYILYTGHPVLCLAEGQKGVPEAVMVPVSGDDSLLCALCALSHHCGFSPG